MDKKTENGEYVPTQYDLLVKYNQDVEIPEQISFKDFWNLEGTENQNTKIGNNYLTVDEPTYFKITVPYTGYLKIKGKFNSQCSVLIDGIELMSPQLSDNFVFEGQVKEYISITSVGLDSCTFTEFSTSTYNFSQGTKDFYSNIPENNNDAWGELTIEANANFNGNVSWCEPLEDDSFDKMEFWEHNFVEQFGVDGVDHGSKIYRVSAGASVTEERDSGYVNLITQSFDKLPILIHENDIGKKNTIGPLKDDKDNEIYINLTIM